MAEYNKAYQTKTIKYSGLFNINKIHKFLIEWIKQNGFIMFEGMTQEQVFTNEKQLTYNYKPYKNFTDFAKAVIYLDVSMNNITDVTIEEDNKKKKMQKGNIEISVTGFIETDYENKWETKPFYYFLKIVFEKFFLGGHRSYYESFVKKSCQTLYEDTKAMLNIHSLKV